MSSWITICDTCKRDDWATRDMSKTDGEVLAEQIEALASDAPGVSVRRHSCLMGCSHGCNVTIQGPGKLAYTLGRFEGTAEDAAGILEYAQLHAESETGQVPFRQWPQAIKGHFVTRHPPLPDTDG